jgi:hypothetical protein
VEFVQPRAHVKTIERHFGCPVVCGAPRNAIIFRATDANRPFVTRNAELLGILVPQFDEELKEENGDESFIERVRIAIQQRLTGRRPTSRTSPKRSISVPVPCSDACRTMGPASSAFWKKPVISLLATILITLSSN